MIDYDTVKAILFLSASIGFLYFITVGGDNISFRE